MEFVYGKATDKMQYFGLWLGEGGVHAELTNVHCYDVDGNDLGIRITLGRGLVLNADKRLENDTEIDHRYDITINNQANIAISNLKKPTTSKVYMEYEVETAEYSFNQEGIALSNKPEADYPYTNGILQHNNYDANDNQIMLLEVGAKYIIYMERTKAGLDVYVQKMKDGMRTIHVFPLNFVSNTKETFEFFSLWFGDSKLGSFKLTNFKCYDANKNNLGVQCNRKAEIQHFGLMEDYAGCEATYYCKETENSFALYSDQQLKFTENNSTQDGIYAISENVMTAKIGEDTKKYSYLFKRITDEDGRKYDRLYKYTVTFVTGTSEKIAVQNLSNEHGYFAMKPDEPKLEGYEFEGWCLIDGTFFDFDKIVTESTTLYAKYSGDGGITFLAGAEEENTSGVEIPDIVWVVAGIILLFIGSVICILFIRKGYKNGRINRN